MPSDNRFEPALWNDSDPTYAPLAAGKPRVYWRPSKRFIVLGYPATAIRLPGLYGDGRDLERAAEARRLTRAMLTQMGEGPDVLAGTWAWLIRRYRTDKFSPLQETKANTRDGYLWMLDRWNNAIGHLPIGAMNYESLKTIQHAMTENGRSVDYVHRMFNTLRRIVRYGSALGNAEAKAVSSIMHEMRFRTPKKREVAPSRDQIRAIIDEADARGMHSFALGLMLQWVFALRGNDVFGQWFKIPEQQAKMGGIVRKRIDKATGKGQWRRWGDGLTWDMIEPDLSAFTKTISKTEKTMPRPQRFDMTGLPEIRARLRLLGNGGRVGPVIVADRDGAPYTTSGRGHAFTRLRDALGLPADLLMMDTRAGAITEGAQKGASLIELRDTAGHASAATTQRYLRDRDDSRAKVVKLRGE
jgi:integrase